MEATTPRRPVSSGSCSLAALPVGYSNAKLYAIRLV
jgi:hypothetical protein